MNTKKQEELVSSYLSAVAEDIRPVYSEIISYLSELGYHPEKSRSNIAFKHDLHNKQMAKLGMAGKKVSSPFFALRFSACKGYSQRFADIVLANITKYPSKTPGCVVKACTFCAGDPDMHIYTYTYPNGERKSHCGAYALEIPDITANDLPEIKALIKEEHDFLIKHEAQ